MPVEYPPAELDEVVHRVPKLGVLEVEQPGKAPAQHQRVRQVEVEVGEGRLDTWRHPEGQVGHPRHAGADLGVGGGRRQPGGHRPRPGVGGRGRLRGPVGEPARAYAVEQPDRPAEALIEGSRLGADRGVAGQPALDQPAVPDRQHLRRRHPGGDRQPGAGSHVGEAPGLALVQRDLEQQRTEGAGGAPIFMRVSRPDLAHAAHRRRFGQRGFDQCHDLGGVHAALARRVFGGVSLCAPR